MLEAPTLTPAPTMWMALPAGIAPLYGGDGLGAVLGDASSSAIITGALAALLALLAGLLRGGRQPARVPVPARNKRDRRARR